MQAVGILFEDYVTYFFSYLRSRGVESRERKTTKRVGRLDRGVGYLWVIFWLSWTVPGWLFPMLERTKGGEGEAVVGFSFLSLLMR